MIHKKNASPAPQEGKNSTTLYEKDVTKVMTNFLNYIHFYHFFLCMHKKIIFYETLKNTIY